MDRRFELTNSFIILYMGLAKRLKSLQDDFPPKVDQSEMKASVPSIMIVFRAEMKYRAILLKAPSTSNFNSKIGVDRYFNRRARIT